MTDTKHYDIAIIGGGLAGMSAAYHLGKAGHLDDHRVALIDPERKEGHDRSWSYWSKGDDDFGALAHSVWSRMVVANRDRFLDLDLTPYRYKHIRSNDFYGFVNAYLDQQPNLVRVFGSVDATAPVGNGYRVSVNGTPAPVDRALTATYLLDSRPRPVDYRRTDAPYLDQHFRGWFLRTKDPVFDPARAHLMDFRLPQRGECRFVYVLPSSPHEAMVEFTAFSNNHLSEETYAAELGAYLAEHWTNDYEIVGREGGNIPMTTHAFPVRDGNHIYIGLGGGAARPSTGYTFYGLQRQLRALAHKFPTPGTIAPWPTRHLYYDATILRILQEGLLPGDAVFVDLFAKNPPARVLSFLNGESSLFHELALMHSTDIPTFGRIFLKEAVKKVR